MADELTDPNEERNAGSAPPGAWPATVPWMAIAAVAVVFLVAFLLLTRISAG